MWRAEEAAARSPGKGPECGVAEGQAAGLNTAHNVPAQAAGQRLWVPSCPAGFSYYKIFFSTCWVHSTACRILSFPTSDGNRAPCSGSGLKHWTSREVPALAPTTPSAGLAGPTFRTGPQQPHSSVAG